MIKYQVKTINKRSIIIVTNIYIYILLQNGKLVIKLMIIKNGFQKVAN